MDYTHRVKRIPSRSVLGPALALAFAPLPLAVACGGGNEATPPPVLPAATATANAATTATAEPVASGPLDTNQAWLALPSLTPSAQLWAFTHTGDPQHPGHLDAFETMGLPGAPTRIEDGGRPWAGSHRLFTSVTTADPHGSTQAGGSSPRTADGGYRFAPVWQEMYEH